MILFISIYLSIFYYYVFQDVSSLTEESGGGMDNEQVRQILKDRPFLKIYIYHLFLHLHKIFFINTKIFSISLITVVKRK